MKKLAFIMLLLVPAYCTAPNWTINDYPKEINEKGYREQYDQAKLEAYKLSLGFYCTCKGTFKTEPESPNIDTVTLVESEVQMINFEEEGDTLFFYLDYFAKGAEGKYHETTTIDNWECPDFLVIGIHRYNRKPILAYLDDKGLIDYNDNKMNRYRDSVFADCYSQQTKVHPWLKGYLKVH